MDKGLKEMEVCEQKLNFEKKTTIIIWVHHGHL